MPEPLNYDDNGITGLFCSHSEVVFRRFQNKKLSARGFSLWHFFPSLLFSSTCFLIHFHYNTAFCFVNIFSATVSRLKSQAINAKLYLRNIISSFYTTMFAFCWQICTDCPSFRFALCLFYSFYASLASSFWNSSPEVFHPNISLG